MIFEVHDQTNDTVSAVLRDFFTILDAFNQGMDDVGGILESWVKQNLLDSKLRMLLM